MKLIDQFKKNESAEKKIMKARVLEQKADGFVKKNKLKKAFDCYEQALELDEQRLELYDKLIQLHEKLSQNQSWTEEDFAYNLDLTMRRQEIQNPTFKRIHARNHPEYKQVLEIIKKMIAAKEAEIETQHVEEIIALGADALYPLIDFVLGFKEMGKPKTGKK